jgi:addiction module RelE/StbE family toxin
MKRKLLKSNSFKKTTKRILKKNPELFNDIQNTLELLMENAFHPHLKTHKLKGNLSNSWACSVTFNIRIIFEFVDYSDREAILLEVIGTHNEVY